MMNFWKRIMFCLMTLALIAGAVSLPLAEDGPAFVMAANAEGVGSPVIPPHEHRGGGATCTQAGVCDVCGEVYIDPQGHDWGAWTDYRYNLKTNLITQRRVCRLNEEHEEWQDITIPAPDPNAPKRLSAETPLKIYRKVTKITLGKNVTAIDEYAFSDCRRLTTIIIKSTGMFNLNLHAFSGLTKDQMSKIVIKVPRKMENKYYKLLLSRLKNLEFTGKVWMLN